jgi:hypothetical protein
MNNKGNEQLAREFHELNGAVDVLNELKQKLEVRLGESRDDCVGEVMVNIITLIDAQSVEYRRRRDEKRARMLSGTLYEFEQ